MLSGAADAGPQVDTAAPPMMRAMTRRSACAAVLVALTLSACAAAGPSPTTTAPPAASQDGSIGGVLDQARDVAAQLEDREADLESIIP